MSQKISVLPDLSWTESASLLWDLSEGERQDKTQAQRKACSLTKLRHGKIAIETLQKTWLWRIVICWMEDCCWLDAEWLKCKHQFLLLLYVPVSCIPVAQPNYAAIIACYKCEYLISCCVIELNSTNIMLCKIRSLCYCTTMRRISSRLS